jgi:hypothetical protein
MGYDEQVIGVGNSNHPANTKENYPSISTLGQALNYYNETGDAGPLAELAQETIEANSKAVELLIKLSGEARALDNTYIANRLHKLKELL